MRRGCTADRDHDGRIAIGAGGFLAAVLGEGLHLLAAGAAGEADHRRVRVGLRGRGGRDRRRRGRCCQHDRFADGAADVPADDFVRHPQLLSARARDQDRHRIRLRETEMVRRRADPEAVTVQFGEIGRARLTIPGRGDAGQANLPGRAELSDRAGVTGAVRGTSEARAGMARRGSSATLTPNAYHGPHSFVTRRLPVSRPRGRQLPCTSPTRSKARNSAHFPSVWPSRTSRLRGASMRSSVLRPSPAIPNRTG